MNIQCRVDFVEFCGDLLNGGELAGGLRELGRLLSNLGAQALGCGCVLDQLVNNLVFVREREREMFSLH